MDRHFLTWLHCRTNWSSCIGWAAAIEQRHPAPDKALNAFFRFVDKYRQLKLSILCTAVLGAGHNPTGKRVRYGYDGLMDKPSRVDVVRYRPEQLHFLRFHYGNRVEDWDLLMTGAGKYTTTARFAKEWVRDELQVKFKDWEQIRKSPRLRG